MILSSNGWLKKKWKSFEQTGVSNPLMEKLFYYRDGQVLKTHLGHNAVMGLSPEITGYLVRILMTDPVLLLRLDDSFFEKWHASYMNTPMREENRQLKKISSFKKDAKAFLTILYNYVHEFGKTNETIDLLLSHMMMEIDDAKVVTEAYAQGLGIECTVTYYTDKDYKEAYTLVSNNFLEPGTIRPLFELIYLASSLETGLRSYLSCDTDYVMYREKYFAACKEVVIRKIVSLALYNGETHQLDIKMLPESLQKTVSCELKEFVDFYGSKFPDDEAYKAAFLELIENKKEHGIEYANDIYEITGSIDNCIAILKMLFGIEDAGGGSSSEQFFKVLHLLFDTDKRFIVSQKQEEQDCWNFTLSYFDDDTKSIQVSIEWDASGHADMEVTLPDDSCAEKFLNNLYYASEYLELFLLGMYSITLPEMLYYLQERKLLQTKEEFVHFFLTYSSAYGKKSTEIFEGNNIEWGFFFEYARDRNCISVAAFEAAIETGLKKEAKLGGFTDAVFGFFCNEGDFDGVQKVLNWVIGVPSNWFWDIVYSNLSSVEKKEAIKKIFEENLVRISAADMLSYVHKDSIDLLPVNEFGLNRCDDDGNSLIMLAFLKNKFLRFEILLKAGANLTIVNHYGQDLYQMLLNDVSRKEELLNDLQEYKDDNFNVMMKKTRRLLYVIKTLLAFQENEMSPDTRKTIETAYERLFADVKKKIAGPLPS